MQTHNPKTNTEMIDCGNCLSYIDLKLLFKYLK